MYKNYLKLAWRNLLKNRVTGFINIAGLAIGMAVALMIGLWLHDELTFNQTHANYDQLTQLYLNQTFNDETNTSRAISLPTRPVLEENFGSDFAAISLSSWNFQHILANGDKQILKRGVFVEPVFLDMFSFNMLAGTYEDALKDPNSIVLSASVAKALFGTGDPMGQTIRFDAVSDLEVTGVYEDFPKNSSLFEAKCLIPWAYYRTQNNWIQRSEENWGNHSFQLYAQLNGTSDLAAVNQKIKDIEKSHNPEAKPEYHFFPMSKWHLYGEFKNGVNTGGRIQYVWLFGIIGVFVLILACINFMNLSTARSEKRAKEVGIRKTIGSMRGQLIGQFLSESLLVSFLSLLFALILVQLSLSWFNEIADKALVIPWTNAAFWGLLFTFTFITGLLAGSYPAFYLSSFQPLKVLKGTFQSGRWSSLPRQVLVTVQFTVSIVLIIGTLVVFQQIQHAKNRPIGYDRDNIIQFLTNQELDQKLEVFRNDLLKTGMIEEAAHSSGPVTEVWSNQSGFDWEGKDPDLIPSFAYAACSYEFGKTVGWEIIEGRDFSRDFATDTSAMILNEAAVALIGIDNIVGKSIEYSESPYQVIGIVKNMIMESPWTPVKPTAFSVDDSWVNVHTLRLKDGIPVRESLAAIQGVFETHSPSSPFEYEFVDDEYNAKFQSEERIGSLAKVFAFLAVFISCLGLFGLSAYVAERRTKEIGIRKVLGASLMDLWAMQSKGFLWLVILSCLIAIPVAWYYLSDWLADYDYRIELGWSVFVLSVLLALLVTLLTVSYQSIRAALSNPSKSLRSE